MTLGNELKAILHVIPRLCNELWESEYNIIRHYWKILSIVLLMLLFGAGAFFGYRWYRISSEQKVQVRLAMQMQEYQRAMQTGSNDELIQLESLLEFEYVQNKAASVAPLLLVLRANVQIKQEKYTEALDSLQRAINAFPAKSPFVLLLKTKGALILLDNNDETMQQLGVQELIQLARDIENKFRDVALFYLGRYYWAHDALDDAKRTWQELLDTPEYMHPVSSVWAQEASEQLKQVSE